MAFSTQKEFLHVAFLNEHPQARCLRMEGVRLRTYAGTIDERSWCMNKDKQAQYLLDLVACRMYKGIDEMGEVKKKPSKPRPCAPTDPFDPCGRTEADGPCLSEAGEDLPPILPDDSLMHVAIEEIGRLEGILLEKKDLKDQLEVSQEKLRILQEEEEAINRILADEHDPEVSCELENLINCLKCAGKIDKDDEDELLKIRDAFCKREKAYEIMAAQNSYLRRLVEKLSLRGRLATIPVEPEKCTDVRYLQCQLDNLRKELLLLREMEDKELSKEVVSRGTAPPPDTDCVATILAERNALREKCQHFAAMEKKICAWKHDSEVFQCFRQEACNAIRKRNEQIQDLHEEIDDLQCELRKWEKCCKIKDAEGESLCTTFDCLKDENRKLRQELCRCRCDLGKMKTLKEQIKCLTNELCEKNCVIEQYDLQFQQLLCVIEELQERTPDIRAIRGLEGQSCQEVIEELANTTRATLDQISRELHSRQAELSKSREEFDCLRQQSDDRECENQRLADELSRASLAVRASFDEFALCPPEGEDCATQIARLKAYIEDLKCQYELEKACAQRQSQDSELKMGGSMDRLRSENEELARLLKECQAKVKAQQERIAQLEAMANNLQTGVKDVNKLVTDISNVQSQNDNLKNVLDAADDSECRKLLEAEKNKNLELSRLLDAEKKKSEGLEASVAKLNSQIADCQRLVEEEKKKNASLASQLEEEKKKIDALNASLAEEKKKAAEAAAAAAAAAAALAEEKKKAEAAAAALAAANAALEAEKKKAADAAAEAAAAKAAAEEEKRKAAAAEARAAAAEEDRKRFAAIAEEEKKKAAAAAAAAAAAEEEKRKALAMAEEEKKKAAAAAAAAAAAEAEKNKALAMAEAEKQRAAAAEARAAAAEEEKNKALAMAEAERQKAAAAEARAAAAEEEAKKALAMAEAERQKAAAAEARAAAAEAEAKKAWAMAEEEKKKAAAAEARAAAAEAARDKALAEADAERKRAAAAEARAAAAEADRDKALAEAEAQRQRAAAAEARAAAAEAERDKALAEADAQRKRAAAAEARAAAAEAAAEDAKKKAAAAAAAATAARPPPPPRVAPPPPPAAKKPAETLQKSVAKLSTKMEGRPNADFERAFRKLLEDFAEEICCWRCRNKHKELTTLEEICQKILDVGIECLTYNELLCVHQCICEAAKLVNPCTPYAVGRCCKCSGQICNIPSIPKESEKMLLDKLAVLEKDIISARENLRRIKAQQGPCIREEGQMPMDAMSVCRTRFSSGK